MIRSLACVAGLSAPYLIDTRKKFQGSSVEQKVSSFVTKNFQAFCLSERIDGDRLKRVKERVPAQVWLYCSNGWYEGMLGERSWWSFLQGEEVPSEIFKQFQDEDLPRILGAVEQWERTGKLGKDEKELRAMVEDLTFKTLPVDKKRDNFLFRMRLVDLIVCEVLMTKKG